MIIRNKSGRPAIFWDRKNGKDVFLAPDEQVECEKPSINNEFMTVFEIIEKETKKSKKINLGGN